MKKEKPLNDIEFHKKRIRLMADIITGIEADREWCDLICSGVDPCKYDINAILDHRSRYQESIEFYQKRFLESKNALEAVGLDCRDFVETPEKLAQKQLAWEKSMGIRRFTRWQYFWRSLFSNKWKQIY